MIIIATADNHIGFKQYGLKQRETDIENSFWRILETGVKENAAAVTVSGDLLHSVRPTSSSIGFLKKCQDFLYDHNLPCLVSEGNHDKSNPHWITNISGKERDKGFVFLDNESYDLDGYRIFANSFTTREGFQKGAYVPEDTDMVLMHQQFSEFANFPNDKVFDCSDFENIANPVLVIVGDIHVTSDFTCEEGHRVFSPGSSELMSEGENESKYVYKISTESNTVDNYSIETRNVLRQEVREESDIDGVVEAINKSPGSLVFLKFNTAIEKLISRIRAATRESECILRPKPIMEYNGKEITFSEDASDDVCLVEVLQEMVDGKNPVFQIASQLTNPGADVVSLVDDFVDRRLREL